VASPLATGGAGTVFEYRLAAVVLAALLRGDSALGLDAVVEEVGLQRRVAGHHLDDIVVRGRSAPDVDLVTEYQVKRRLQLVSTDEDFLAVVRGCLSVVDADPAGVAHRRHRVGIAAGGPIGPLRALQELAEIARSHATAQSFAAALTSARAAVRERHSHLREAIRLARLGAGGTEPDPDELDGLAWHLASALDVQIVEVEGSGRDVREALNRLRDAIPEGHDSVEAIYARLVELGEAWGPHAGQITAGMLRAELERRGVALSVDRRHAVDLRQLTVAGDSVLAGIPTAIAGQLQLPREVLVDRVTQALEGTDPVLLTGAAGVGKTSLAALAVRRMKENGATVATISLNGRTGQRLAQVEAELGVRLRTALAAAPTTGSRIIFIDGAEQALTDGAALLTDVLRAVPTRGDDAPQWRVAITARDEAADAVAEIVAQATGSYPTRLSVDDLTDGEIAEILDSFPRLRPLDRHERPRRLLRRPYIVDLLVRSTVHADLPDGVLGEEDVLDVVYLRLIRRGEGILPGRGAPDNRSDLFIAMADGILAGDPQVRLDARDAEARAGMVSDDILRPARASFAFAHDILSDYAVAARLLEPDGPSALAVAPYPRRVLRAVRLWMQHRLAHATRDTMPEAWAEVTRAAAVLAAADGPRWLDTPFEALLNLGRPSETLDALAPILLAGEDPDLAKLLDVADRLARTRTPPEEDDPRPPIDHTASAPVVAFLARNAVAIPAALWLSALDLTRKTLSAIMGRPGIDVQDPLPDPRTLADVIVAWASDSSWGDPFDDALVSLALLAGHLTDAAQAFLLQNAHDRPAHMDVVVEDPIAGPAMARSNPELALRLAGAYYVNRDLTLDTAEDLRDPEQEASRPWYHVEWSQGVGGHDEGIRDHSPRHFRISRGISALAHPSLGPFAALLDASPRHGLRLVGFVVDAASNARVRLEATWGDSEITLDLQLPGWPARRTYRGTAHVYMWYRRLSVGPYAAMSALMALRDWAVRSVHSGRSLRDVTEDILTAGDSIAFVAVAFSLLVDQLETAPPELDAFLCHPSIWHLEIARVVNERGGLGLAAPEASRLLSTPSDIAMELVLRSDAERRQRLKKVGQQLLAADGSPGASSPEPADVARPEASRGAEEPLPREELLLRRRWAAELDVDTYRTEPHDEGVLISVDYPQEVVRGLEETGGRRSAQFLELSNLGFQASQVRDGQLDADPVLIWDRLHELHAELSPEDLERMAPFGHKDGLAAAAAAIIVTAHRGAVVPDRALAAAVTLLLDVARAVRLEPFDHQLSRDRRMVWDIGADRSAASGLATLLLDDSLRDRTGTLIEDVGNALLALASSVFAEVRTHLASGLQSVWAEAYEGQPHDVALAMLQELVRTSGLGPWQETGYRPRVRLADPMEQALQEPGLTLMPESAADALPGLIAAARLHCGHAKAASRLLNALVDVDLRVWPTDLARHHYEMGTWRGQMDRLTAELALEGNPDQLRRYLSAFATVGEDLRGLLIALANAATTPERAAVLHDIWPEIFDALLPEARSLDRNGDRRPYHGDVDELDAVLLPMPPAGSAWPLDRTALLFWRWVGAFRGAAHVVDRCIEFLMRCGWLISPNATGAVLIVLGDHIESISRESRLVVPWLDVALRRPEAAGEHATRVRTLLDRLAAFGDEGALRLQRTLEA